MKDNLLKMAIAEAKATKEQAIAQAIGSNYKRRLPEEWELLEASYN